MNLVRAALVNANQIALGVVKERHFNEIEHTPNGELNFKRCETQLFSESLERPERQ
jgi:hypothetical protein